MEKLLFFDKVEDFCFLHIPKTGGRSLETWLEFNDFDITYKGHDGALPPNEDCQNIIAFFRNPAKRVLSAYYYLMDGGVVNQRYSEREKFLEPYKDFEDFVINGLKFAKNNEKHFYPQHKWLIDDSGNFVPDVLIRTSNLDSGWMEFCSFFLDNIDRYYTKFPHSNKSNHESLDSEYSVESLMKVSLDYKKDTELFIDLFSEKEVNKFQYFESFDCYVF